MYRIDEKTLGEGRFADTPSALGQSEAFLAFEERLSRVASVERPVLILGERGTGKELAARRLHFLSKRWQEPLVALNCAALAPSLIESELFGHEMGAFTGAVARRRGRFESAHGGTLFLDELGNIPLEVQEKILRVVEYGLFERVGGSEAVRADVRIIGATNADLAALAQQGKFKCDLLDRLSFEVLHIPALRERPEDILFLANHFAAQMAHELSRPGIPEFGESVIAQLESYPWPGNIRELKNVVERAVYQASSDRIAEVVFDPFQRVPGFPPTPSPGAPETPLPPAMPAPLPRLPFQEAVEAHEIQLLRAALREARFNQRLAAKRLGLTYHQFRGLYRKYGDRLET